MKVLICGDRNWINSESIRNLLVELSSEGYNTIIEGEANGADSISRIEGEKLGFNIIKFPAQWDKYGKAAGVIRNQQMLDEGKPNLVVAFHSDIEKSKGTKDMINRAKKQGFKVILKIE